MKAALLLLVLGVAAPASAQRAMAVSVGVGSGTSLGTGESGDRAAVALRRSPTFLDLELATWNPERPDPVLGAALRVEIDGRVAVGVVPRASIRRPRGGVELRAAFGLPIFVAPFSLVGAEVASGLGIPLGGGFSLVADVLVGAYFWGSDLPDDATLVKLDLRIGLELRP
ncbi:MAG: hypothetical protein H6721_10225 [Sandaracinus sp.]|nr:hypothetical protein [Sandaracinus sp.]MCB9632493.1 hypothetical protein [Sandaracinus sp.]